MFKLLNKDVDAAFLYIRLCRCQYITLVCNITVYFFSREDMVMDTTIITSNGVDSSSGADSNNGEELLNSWGEDNGEPVVTLMPGSKVNNRVTGSKEATNKAIKGWFSSFLEYSLLTVMIDTLLLNYTIYRVTSLQHQQKCFARSVSIKLITLYAVLFLFHP